MRDEVHLPTQTDSQASAIRTTNPRLQPNVGISVAGLLDEAPCLRGMDRAVCLSLEETSSGGFLVCLQVASGSWFKRQPEQLLGAASQTSSLQDFSPLGC